MLSGGLHHLMKDKFVLVKMPLNVHIQDEVKLDELLYISSLFCVKDIEDITRWREDMNFMFEWQEQYLATRT